MFTALTYKIAFFTSALYVLKNHLHHNGVFYSNHYFMFRFKWRLSADNISFVIFLRNQISQYGLLWSEMNKAIPVISVYFTHTYSCFSTLLIYMYYNRTRMWSISETIQRCLWRIRHVDHMPPNSITGLAMCWMPQGRKNRGHQKRLMEANCHQRS